MGHVNNRVDKSNAELEKHMGREVKDVTNDNERRLIDICRENDMIITNTTFTH